MNKSMNSRQKEYKDLKKKLKKLKREKQIYEERMDIFLESYEVFPKKVIGKGGFGKVVEGLSKKTGDTVAIKFVKKKKLSDSELARKFPKEYKLLSKVQGVGGVIGLLDYFELQDRYAYVMEKPDNCLSLEAFIDGNYNEYDEPLTEFESKDIWKQLVETTIGCHEKEIYHRDIKPENVLLDGDKMIRLIDFGCGDRLKKEPYFEFSGTPIYNPPEVVKRSGAYYAEPQTVWTLGITLFEMVCGDRPFEKEEEIKKFTGKLPYDEMFNKLSPKCQHTIMSCLTTNPRDRPKLKELLSLPWMIEEGDDFDNNDSNNVSNNDSNSDSNNVSNSDSNIDSNNDSNYDSSNDSNDMNLKVEMPSTKKRKYEDDLESGYTSYKHKKLRRHA